MAKRDKREVRFNALKTFYKMYKAEVLSADPEENLKQAKANIQFSGAVLFESEVEKFAEKNAEIDSADFVEFCKSTGAYKKSGSKGTGDGGHVTRLDTAEAAQEKGCTDVSRYVELTSGVQAAVKELKTILPAGTKIVFSIYKGKEKTD